LYFGPADGKDALGNAVNPASIEQNTVAIQDKGSGQFFAAPGFTVTILKSPQVRDKFLVQPIKVGPGNAPTGAGWNDPVGTSTATMGAGSTSQTIDNILTTGVFGLQIVIDEAKKAEILAKYPGGIKIYSFGRYNSESDFEGNYLGEVKRLTPPARSMGLAA
jgi:hypothetical protein